MSAEINRQLEMIHAVSGCEAKFAVWSRLYIRTKQISQDVEKFVISILMKQKRNGFKMKGNE
jgi:hypothetical protein